MEYCEYKQDNKCELTDGLCNVYCDPRQCIYRQIFKDGYKEGFFDGENGRISKY